MSYYAERSARDPAWREEQLAGAAERERRRRESDPEGILAARRAISARRRERQRAHGLTFAELLARSPVSDPAVLRLVLNDEVRRGTVEYHSTTRRYTLNGALDAETRAALLLL